MPRKDSPFNYQHCVMHSLRPSCSLHVLLALLKLSMLNIRCNRHCGKALLQAVQFMGCSPL